MSLILKLLRKYRQKFNTKGEIFYLFILFKWRKCHNIFKKNVVENSSCCQTFWGEKSRMLKLQIEHRN